MDLVTLPAVLRQPGTYGPSPSLQIPAGMTLITMTTLMAPADYHDPAVAFTLTWETSSDNAVWGGEAGGSVMGGAGATVAPVFHSRLAAPSDGTDWIRIKQFLVTGRAVTIGAVISAT